MKLTADQFIRLLIVAEESHKAEQITSSLRASGLHVRMEFAEDANDMYEILSRKTLDLMLFSLDLPHFTLAQAQSLIRKKKHRLAVIAMTSKLSTNVIVHSISQGAQDAVSAKNLTHLGLVIKREFDCIDQWRNVKRLEHQLQESESRCQSLLINSKDAVAYIHEGMYVYANPAYMKLFGKSDFKQVEGTPMMDMINPAQQKKTKEFLRHFTGKKATENSLELNLIHHSGKEISAVLEFSLARYDAESCIQILIRTAADTAKLEEKIHYLHQRDLVTKLYNRQHFMSMLKKSISLGLSQNQRFALIYIAIDHFPSIRERIGISGCDLLINDIATIIKAQALEKQVVSRFGADSYAIFGQIKGSKNIEKQVAKSLSLIEGHISEIDDLSISVTCSAAIVFIDRNSPANADEIITRAEKTCADAQQAGGNQFSTHSPKADEMTAQEGDDQLVSTIKGALANNRIDALYQPLASIKAIPGERYFSSLMINSEENQTLSDRELQAVADRTGTAKTLDRWAILHAINTIKTADKRAQKVEMMIPLSLTSMLDTELPAWITQSITKVKINASLLVLVVQEKDAMDQLKACKTLFKKIKAMRCKFAVDAFGSGLNPFQLFKHIKPDYARFDPEYMRDLVSNTKNQEHIHQLATELQKIGTRSITAGVEDAAILSKLWTLNIDFVQGDFLQAPDQKLQYDFTSM